MNLFTFIKVIRPIIPSALVHFILNSLARIRFGVRIGPGSVVRKGNIFAGNNVVMNNSEVSNSKLGKYTYIANNSVLRSADVGAFCSIGDYVRTCLGRHPIHFFSTHPQTYSLVPPSEESWVSKSTFKEHKFIGGKYVIKIGNDVWIGNNVIIMDGVTIGDGAIVAAGSIVTKDIDPYTVCAGVPARVIKQRFEKNKVETLLELRWWDMPDEWIRENIEYLRSL